VALSAAVLFFALALGGAAVTAVTLLSTQPTPTRVSAALTGSTPTRTATPRTPTPVSATSTPTPRAPTPVPPTYTPIPVGALLFQDNMQANTNNWCTADFPDRQFYFIGGTYHIVNQTPSSTYWCPKTDLVYSSLAFEADMTKVGGPDKWDYGIVFRQNGQDGYFFSITGDGRYALSRHVAALDGFDNLINFTPTDAVRKGDSKNRLKVVARGPEITLYINDFWVATYRDTNAFAAPSGNIALFVGPGVHASVSAVRVFAVG
jgi:hypothetical protein